MLKQINSSIPSTIGDITITLKSKNETGDTTKSADFLVRVLNQRGEVMGYVDGDLVPHITQSDISALIAFMDKLRLQAIAEVLPA